VDTPNLMLDRRGNLVQLTTANRAGKYVHRVLVTGAGAVNWRHLPVRVVRLYAWLDGAWSNLWR
jgi:hypothetical protein